MTLTVDTHFVLEIAGSQRPLFERHQEPLSGALSQALTVAFGLELGTPVRLSLVYGEQTRLLEANGVTHRVPDPLEVQGVLLGAVVGALTLLDLQPRSLDLRGGRITDA